MSGLMITVVVVGIMALVVLGFVLGSVAGSPAGQKAARQRAYTTGHSRRRESGGSAWGEFLGIGGADRGSDSGGAGQ
jgi:type II secretory pathway pseudopilin PulG